MVKELFYVIIWDAQAKKEVAIDENGKKDAVAKAVLFEEKKAHEVAKKFGGRVMNDREYNDESY